jgi:hypothetical protein
MGIVYNTSLAGGMYMKIRVNLLSSVPIADMILHLTVLYRIPYNSGSDNIRYTLKVVENGAKEDLLWLVDKGAFDVLL